MASKLSTNTSTNYRRTLPNTGGNSKAVELVVALAAILIGFIFQIFSKFLCFTP